MYYVVSEGFVFRKVWFHVLVPEFHTVRYQPFFCSGGLGGTFGSRGFWMGSCTVGRQRLASIFLVMISGYRSGLCMLGVHVLDFLIENPAE